MFTNRNKISNNSFFMKLALDQAKKNLGNTNENPSVGCIITKNNLVIAAGSTSIKGRPHAEHNAIIFSKAKLNNCEIFTTLEPCSHHGVTSPCTNKIIKKKFKKVHFSLNDPDIRSFNKSIKIFNKKKISVTRGVNYKSVKEFYRSYFKYKNETLPFLTCKLATSKDFYTISKKDKWITNKFSRARGHLIRSVHDCIITSSTTIINDNPELTCRIDGLNYTSPARIILDKKLKVSLKSKVITQAKKFKTIIFYNKTNYKKIRNLKSLNVDLYQISLDEEGNLDLYQTLLISKELGYQRILLESGTKLINSFFNKNLIDDFKLFISNKNLGRYGKNNIKKNVNFFLKNINFFNEKVNLFGDKLITYKIK